MADVLGAARARMMPPEDVGLAEWMERHVYLPKSVSERPGPVVLDPDQRGIADAISDPANEFISVMKSSRRGMTMILVGAVFYRATREGGNILLVQPNKDDAQDFGKDQMVPMVEASEVMSEIFPVSKAKDKSQTLTRKEYSGGTLYLIGAHSGAGFRRKLAPWSFLDEVDGYPPSAGDDGDQVKLAAKRGQTSWERKIVAISTPLIKGRSKIETLFLQGDQRRFFVPCTQCGHMDHLTFLERPSGGHWMHWEEDPSEAVFICSANGCVIEETDKEAMLQAGEWRATADAPTGRVSFHIWAAYGMDPKATWSAIAQEHVDAEAEGPAAMRVFYNQTLGETFKEVGEAPDWEILQLRAEDYPIGTVPEGVEFLTAGVDVGKDRLIYEVVGWDFDRRSWSVDAGVLMGAPADPGTWEQLDELLDREWPGATRDHRIVTLAIDSGYATQEVYRWCRKHRSGRRVIAVQGSTHARVPIGTPKKVDVTVRGRLLKRGALYRPVGVDLLKEEFYGWLHMSPGESEPPPGWCRFPKYDREYWRQITGEHLVSVAKKGGYTDHAWEKIPGRENHWLDCRIYARAAAAHHGVDRVRPTSTSTSSPVQHAVASELTPTPRAAEPARSRPTRSKRGGRKFFDRPMKF